MDELHNLTDEARTLLNTHMQKRLNREYSTGFFHGLVTGAVIAILSLTVGLQVR